MSARSSFDPDLATFAGRNLVCPVADEWAAVQEVADTLGISHSLAAQLMISELAGELAAARGVAEPAAGWVIRSGRRLLMPRAGLDILHTTPLADPIPARYINVRLGPGTWPVERFAGRRYLGYHRSFSSGELYNASVKWWLFKNLDAWVGEVFIASIAGFVVLTGRIRGFRQHPHAEVIAFDVDVDDTACTEALLHRRIPVHPGGPALKIGAPTSARRQRTPAPADTTESPGQTSVY